MVFLKKGGSFPVVDDQNPLEGQGFGLDLKEKKGREKAEMEWGGNNNSGKEKKKI